MIETVLTAFFAGLSSGIYCFAYCTPFIATYLVSDERDWRGNLAAILKFLAGRLAGYVLFGAAIGLAGERIDARIVDVVMSSAMILLSLLLILSAIGLIEAKRFSFCAGVKAANRDFPLLMGFLMGVNVCPPFLMSVAYVFSLHSALMGILYFLAFFAGTSVYLLPLFFVGLLGRFREFQWVGRIAAVAVGVAFLAYGVYRIF